MKSRKYWLAFNQEWFSKHQRVLLWLLATWPFSRIMRWMLCVRSHDIGYRAPIVQLKPNCYVALRGFREDGRAILTLESRTHWKYSKRIYFSLKYFWWACHAWDWLIADRLLPEFSFGLSTLTAYPDADPETSTVDGIAYRAGTSEAWGTLKAGAGNGSNDTDAVSNFAYADATGSSNIWNQLRRAIFLFNTSALTGLADISSATLSLYGNFKSDTASNAPTLDIFTATPAGNTGLVNADFSQVGSVSQTGAALSYASFSTSAYNDFALNGTGLGNISRTGISKFSSREASYDAGAGTPTWASGADFSFQGYFADNTGTANDPKLVVTYTVSAINCTENIRLRPGMFMPGNAR